MTLKKLYLGVVLGVLALSPIAHAQTAPVIVGETAPDYTFTDINGKQHSISGLKGKMVVLEWTNPGCPFVKKYYSKGDMQTLQANSTKAGDTVWIAVNSSGDGKEGYLASDADFKKLIAEQKSHATYYVRDPKGTFGKLYGAKTTPHMFVIDKNGVLAYQGAIDNIKSPDQADIAKATPYVTDALNALRKGDKVAMTTTQSYGCGVKYADDAATADPTQKR
jgi:peroxiredoxin